MLFSSVLLTSEPWKETTSCQFFVFNCTTKRPDNETLFLGLFHFCFFPEVRKYLASKELPFKVFFSGGGGGNSHSHPEPHEFRAEGTNVVCCCCWVTSVMSDSVQPHRRQPARLPRPWDSPGKNTEVGCHFLLQCMKVKSESEVTQSCLTLSDPMDCSLPGSSVHGVLQATVLEWGAIAFSANVVYLLLNTMSLIQPLDQRVIRTFTMDCQLYGRESWWNIIKVWKDYTLGDAITVIEKPVKSTKLQTINSFWRKLCPDVSHDFIGFTIEPIKEIMWI